MAQAASDDSDDEFSRALECSIHLGVIRHPKALPCQHTFCRDCLEQLVSGSQIECPFCRKICHLSAGGVDDLPKNVALQDILDTLCVSCQKTHIRTTCPCCQQQLCDKCKVKHASNLQIKIIDKKQDLRNMARILSKTSRSIDQNKLHFLSQVNHCKSDVKAVIDRAIDALKRRGAHLEAELNSLIKTETEGIDQFQENIKKKGQEIQAALERSDGDDTAILENLERLSENITTLLSTMTVTPATVSCKLDEEPIQDVCMGLGQIEYKSPQPGSGAPTALLQYQPVAIDYQAVGTPMKVFGQRGSGPGQFNYPTHIAVSPVTGNLVICDKGNSRVQVFTADGKFLRMFGSKAKGKSIFNFWSKGTTEGQFEFGYLLTNGGVTVTDAGEIVIADTDNHRLQVFDEAGRFVRVIGSKGSAPGKFDSPTGVTCDHTDQLYICDENNQRVQVMTMAGSVVRVIAASDVPGGDWRPGDIAVCPDGDLVVADWGTGLHVLSATGQHKAKIPCGEGQHVECDHPTGVAVDAQGHILVTGGSYDGTDRVYVFKKSGKLVCSFDGGGTSPWKFNRPLPVGVAVTQDGGIIVVDHFDHRVQIF